MKRFSGKRNKKGFTTTELMLVVAILAVVIGIAVTGLVKLYRELKITKLDDIAREIYTSAQSRTISLSVGGQLSQVESQEVKNPIESVSDDADSSPETAKDKYVYRASADSESTKGTEMILPLGSIEEVVRQNYYIIEYSPVTGMVNRVYYWENEGNDFKTACYDNGNYLEEKTARMKYDGGMVGFYGGGDAVVRDDYNSDVTAELVNDEELYLNIMQGWKDGKLLKGTITVTLTDLDRHVSKKMPSFKNEDGLGNGKDLSFSMTKKNKAGGEDTTPHYKLTLDSLNPKLRFSDLVPEEDGAFHPGCNLKVTVSFKENGKQVKKQSFLTNSLFASVKGKYGESRTAYISCGRHLENLGVLWVYPEKAEKLSDHLNGVKKAVQTADIDWHRSLDVLGGDSKDSPISFKPIVNENLEEFDGKGNKISHMDIFGNVNGDILKGYKDTSSVNLGIGLFSKFTGNQLQNINLVNCTVENLTFDGSGSKSLSVGLLAGIIDKAEEINNAEVFDKDEETDKIDGTGKIEVIGGTSKNTICTVSDCHAYATDGGDKADGDEADGDEADGDEAVGASEADDTSTGGETADNTLADKKGILPCYIAVPANTNSAGGLFGSIQNINSEMTEMKMEKCSASLTQIGGSAGNVGGLAGYINSGVRVLTISQCYADTGQWSAEQGEWLSGMSGQNVGGLVGGIGGESFSFTMENSYAVGEVFSENASNAEVSGENASNANGLVGVKNGGSTCTIRYCYAALMQGNDNDAVENLVPESLESAGEINTCINYGGSYDGFADLSTNPGKPYVWEPDREKRADTTCAYGMPNTNADGDAVEDKNAAVDNTDVFSPAYPFPRLSEMRHYGDWPQEGLTTVSMGYYEVYEDNGSYSIGFYNNKFDTLKNDGADVVSDGYALMFPVKVTDQMDMSVKYNGKKLGKETPMLKLMNASDKFGAITNNSIGDMNNEGKISIAGKSYYPLFLSDAMMKENGNGKAEEASYYNKTSYYQRLKVQVDEKVVINVYFNPYVAKSNFVPVEEDEKEEPLNIAPVPEVSIFRTPRQITAFASNAMQEKATKNHTLLLERNITLKKEDTKRFIETDSTILSKTIPCQDLNITRSDANVTLNLNGMTLTGTGESSVVTSGGGQLTVEGNNGTITGGNNLNGGGIYVKDGTFNMTGGFIKGNNAAEGGGIYMENGVTGTLTNVTIKNNTAQSSVNITVNNGVTLNGCKIGN